MSAADALVVAAKPNAPASKATNLIRIFRPFLLLIDHSPLLWAEACRQSRLETLEAIHGSKRANASPMLRRGNKDGGICDDLGEFLQSA
jgi:hypothetical protein